MVVHVNVALLLCLFYINIFKDNISIYDDAIVSQFLVPMKIRFGFGAWFAAEKWFLDKFHWKIDWLNSQFIIVTFTSILILMHYIIKCFSWFRFAIILVLLSIKMCLKSIVTKRAESETITFYGFYFYVSHEFEIEKRLRRNCVR